MNKILNKTLTSSKLLLLFLLLVYASGAEARPMYIPPMPQDLERTDFYLLTVGLGDELYTRFGHTIVRVVDRQAEADYNFNWGTFDFDEPGFAVKFFRGILMYRMALASYEQTLTVYRDWEQRRVWQEKLNLTTAQKKTLMTRIIWNAQPQNIRYPYQYFYNNCATKVRDYIDEALGGRVALALKDTPAEPRTVYRDYVRRHLGGNPFVGVSLDVLMNADIDKVMTKWDEMFLPDKLREHLLTISAFADDGAPIEASKLLGQAKVLVDLPDKGLDPSEARGGYLMLMLLGILPFLPTLFRAAKRAAAATQNADSMAPKDYRVLGGGLILWGLIGGAFGTVMVVSWALSAHTDLHHNANLLLFWPVDWLYVAAGLSLVKHGRSLDFTRPVWRFMQMTAYAHAAAVVIMVLLYSVGFITQDVSYVLYYLAPAVLMVSAVVAMPHRFMRS